MMALIDAMRPRQWTKNLLIFAGLIFSGNFLEQVPVQTALLLFAAFCLTSSAGYLINDVLDKSSDVLHPEKKERPIASGRLSPSTAVIAAVVLAIAGFAIGTTIHLGWQMLAVYAGNQALYTLVARRVAVLDVFVISQGFVIRAIAGAEALNANISSWLLLCTFLLALFLGFAKRKHEFALGSKSRTSLTGYSAQLLDQLIGITAAATVLSYSVYAIQSETARAHGLLVLTIPFPIFGVFRYLQLVYAENDGGNPDRTLLKDPWMAWTVLIWIALSLFAMSRHGRVTL